MMLKGEPVLLQTLWNICKTLGKCFFFQLIKSCLDPVSWKLTSAALEKSNLQRICFSILAHIPI